MIWMEWLDKAEEVRLLTHAERALRPLLKGRYEELCLQEEIKWKQRSKVQWLRAGDANTRFFHLKACSRRSRNFLIRLSDGSSMFSNHSSIANLLFTFFKNLLGAEPAVSGVLNFGLLFPSDSPSLLSLQDPFGIDEVERSIFSCDPEKAPGPDGFPMIFFQQFWHILRDDVMEVFSNFFHGSLNLEDINSSWICLIPKKCEVTTARDIRPICLENSLIKIISKFLATRLQRFMESLINPFQAAFIKGRSMLDNFYSAHILIHHLHSTNQQAALLKIDFEWAFDHINWQFLLELLQAGVSVIGGMVGSTPSSDRLLRRCCLMASWANTFRANEGFVRGTLSLLFSSSCALMSSLECCRWRPIAFRSLV